MIFELTMCICDALPAVVESDTGMMQACSAKATYIAIMLCNVKCVNGDSKQSLLLDYI